jgi:hypothetical protein
MITKPLVPQSDDVSDHEGLVRHAKRLIKKLGWLSPTASLGSKGGKEFGRRIEASLTEITQGRGVMRLQLRKRDAAVVMSVDHYEEVVRMKVLYAELIEQVKVKEIADGTDDYEALYRRITSPQSRNAADGLFAATSDGLRKTYQPGETEVQ